MGDTGASVIEFSDDQRYFAHSGRDGCLRLWDTSNSTLSQEYVPSSHLSAAATCLSWCKSSHVADHSCRRDDRGARPAAKRHRSARANTNTTSTSCTTPSCNGADSCEPTVNGLHESDSDLLALGTCAGSVLVYSALSAEPRHHLASLHTAAVRCVVWQHSSGDTDTGNRRPARRRRYHVLSSGDDGYVVQSALKSGKVKIKFRASRSPVLRLCLMCDGDGLLAAGRSINWWQLSSQTLLRSFAGHTADISVLRLVPCVPTDGASVEQYFISGSARERVLTAWSLSPPSSSLSSSEKKRRAVSTDVTVGVASFMLLAEPVHVAVTMSTSHSDNTSSPSPSSVVMAGDSGVMVLSAVTATGILHVFKQQLNGVCGGEPSRPLLSVQMACDSSPARPLAVLACVPCSLSSGFSHPPPDGAAVHVLFCYGSLLRPRFETMAVSRDSGPVQCLVRAAPTDTPPHTTSNKHQASKSGDTSAGRLLVAPSSGESNNQLQILAPGFDTVTVERRKRRANNNTTDTDEQCDDDDGGGAVPMERRLGQMTLQQKTAAVNRTGSSGSGMTQLLVQGLHGNDGQMLATVLRCAESSVINNTLDSLPVESIRPLVDKLAHLLRFSDDGGVYLLWLRVLVERHASYFLAQPDLTDVFTQVYSSLQARVRHYPRLLRLKGRLDVLSVQLEARNKHITAGSSSHRDTQQHTALLTYQDDSTDEDIDGLIGGSCDDLLASDEDDHDDSEQTSRTNHKLDNGHNEDDYDDEDVEEDLDVSDACDDRADELHSSGEDEEHMDQSSCDDDQDEEECASIVNGD